VFAPCFFTLACKTAPSAAPRRYPIQIEDGQGVLRSAELKPGDIMFYESAKCYHQRSVPMNGRHYASIFLHYRPVGWEMTREQPRAWRLRVLFTITVPHNTKTVLRPLFRLCRQLFTQLSRGFS